MKIIISIIIIFQVGIVYSQDLIVNVNGNIIKAKQVQISKDSITYIEYTDSLNKVKYFPINTVVSVKYANGNMYRNSAITMNVNKLIKNKQRTNKKGLHIGLNNTVGMMTDEYVAQNQDYSDNYYSSTIGYFARASLNLKLYLNNFFGLKQGVGYDFNNYFLGYNITDRSNSVKYYVQSIVIPTKVFFTPGNKFGFYAEVGIVTKIALTAYYFQTNNGNIYSDSFMNKVSPVSVAFEGVLGLHATIKEKIIIFAGFAPSINIFTTNNSSSIIGFKIGASYHILPIK